jgi:ubiquinone/menaquinone biosynthesis C-methylase UbiE
MSESNTVDERLIFYLHGAAAFQYLHAGVELGVFSLLARRSPLTLTQIAQETELPVNSARCLLFGLTSLRLLRKEAEAFTNDEFINSVFVGGDWELFTSMVEFQAHIVYEAQADFVESLRSATNIGLRRIAGSGATLYQRLSEEPRLKRVFFEYMEAYSKFARRFLFKHVDFGGVRRLLDVGGGKGGNAIALAKRYPSAQVSILDLPHVIEAAKAEGCHEDTGARISYYPCDILNDEFPYGQDCVLFIHQLVIWSPDEIRSLLRKSYDALVRNGMVVIFSSIADDDETGPVMAALDTAYFRAVAAGNGMIYPWKDYREILEDSGFQRVECIRCDSWTPHGIIKGFKL